VSASEIAIEQARGRLAFSMERFKAMVRDLGFDMLPILPAHAIAAGALPRHHGDPFDRMPIAQAQLENMTLVSKDAALMIP
jgi:PIN domain nuclease of toxin-antitoxin system